MIKKDLMFGILLSLLERQRTPARQLAQKYEVSTKTIYRYLSYLESAGVPTVSYNGKNGGTEIAGRFDLSSCYFNNHEIARIISLMQSTPVPELEREKNQIIQKLSMDKKLREESQKYINQIIIDPKPWGKNSAKIELEKILLSHIENKQTITFDYKSYRQNTTRTISPYSLLLKEGSYYLVGKCMDKNALRTFKITRLHNLKKSDTVYEENPLNHQEMLQKIDHSFDKIELKLEVSDNILCDVLEWLEEWKIEIEKDKKIVTGQATNNEKLLQIIMSYKENIKVLSPDSIREKIKDFCDCIKDIYNSG